MCVKSVKIFYTVSINHSRWITKDIFTRIFFLKNLYAYILEVI